MRTFWYIFLVAFSSQSFAALSTKALPSGKVISSQAPVEFGKKLQSAVEGGVHGGGGGNPYCAELSDLYEGIREESKRPELKALLFENSNLGGDFSGIHSLRCYPIDDQERVIDYFQTDLILNWKKWALLSDQDKIWEVSKVLLSQAQSSSALMSSKVDSFVMKLLEVSPVFSKYKYFESLSRSGAVMTFEKPSVLVRHLRLPLGYELWCSYRAPCVKLRFDPAESYSPENIGLGFCRFLGFHKVVSIRWSNPIRHSSVPGLITDAPKTTLVKMTDGVFNGTYQTHSFGGGFTVLMEAVTCER